MRKLCNGEILARRLTLPGKHPWLAICRDRIKRLAAEEEFENNQVAEAYAARAVGHGFYWKPQTQIAEQLEKFPGGEGADFDIASGYELFDRLGCPPAAIAVKVEKVERTGSWKTCQDYWLAIRIDGSYLESKTLDNVALKLLRQITKELEEAKSLRLDMEALDDL